MAKKNQAKAKKPAKAAKVKFNDVGECISSDFMNHCLDHLDEGEDPIGEGAIYAAGYAYVVAFQLAREAGVLSGDQQREIFLQGVEGAKHFINEEGHLCDDCQKKPTDRAH